MQEAGLMGFLFPESVDRDPDRACFPAGQGCGGIHEIKSCREIIDEIMVQAEGILHERLPTALHL